MGFRCLYPACVMAYLLMWLTLITITTGMCLMNVYEFVKVLPAPQSFRDKRRNRWIKIFLFPPVSSLKGYLCSLNSKIFEKLFELFHGDVYTEFHCPFGASLHFCNLLIFLIFKIILHQSSSLNFRQLLNCTM